jgi:DNA-binding NtrC family response regulator
MYAADVLQDAGFKVFEACCAAEAIQELDARAASIHAVVTDVEMPGAINGMGLAALIHERWPEIAVLITSGRMRPRADELPQRCDFIAKPYKGSDVVQCLARIIG